MKRLITTQKIDIVVDDHGIYVPNGIIGAVARLLKVRLVNWHVAYRKKCFIFSHHDTYHHTLVSEPVSSWENIRWNEELEKDVVAYLSSRWDGRDDWLSFNRNPQEKVKKIEEQTGVDFSKTCVGMLTNVMWDAQLHYPANIFSNMIEWAVETISYFAKRPDLQLLIRIHPAEVTGTLPSRQPILREIKKFFSVLPSNVFIIPPESKLSTYVAMKNCDSVIIYGTKTGVELTSMGIPTIVAGEAWIKNKGITFDPVSRQEYFNLLDKLPFNKPVDTATLQRARKYAYHFFFRRMIPVNCISPTNYFPPFKIDVNSIADLIPGKDLGLDIICDGILNGGEFIYPAENVEKLTD
jgi:hypothetical protein